MFQVHIILFPLLSNKVIQMAFVRCLFVNLTVYIGQAMRTMHLYLNREIERRKFGRHYLFKQLILIVNAVNDNTVMLIGSC